MDDTGHDEQHAHERDEGATRDGAHDGLQREVGGDADQSGGHRRDREERQVGLVAVGEGHPGAPVGERPQDRRDLLAVVDGRGERRPRVEKERVLDGDGLGPTLHDGEVERDVPLAGDGEPLEHALDEPDDDGHAERLAHLSTPGRWVGVCVPVRVTGWRCSRKH